jgi:hypothetical protein
MFTPAKAQDAVCSVENGSLVVAARESQPQAKESSASRKPPFLKKRRPLNISRMQLLKTQMTDTALAPNPSSHRTNITPDMTTKKNQTPAPKRRKRKSTNLAQTTVPPRAPSLPNEPLPDPIHINDDTIISF